MAAKDTYRRALLAARVEYFSRIRGQELSEKLYESWAAYFAAVERALAALPADQAIRRAELRRILALGRRAQERLRRLLESSRSAERVVEHMRSAHIRGLTAAAAEAGVKVSGLDQYPSAAAFAAMSVRQQVFGAAKFKTLIRRSLTPLGPAVDKLLRDAVLGGETPGEVVNKLLLVLGSNTMDPVLQKAIRDALSESGRRTWRQILRSKARRDPDLERSLRAAIFDSRRIVVTELNNAHFEADRFFSEKSAAIDLVRWEVSTRHDALSSSPDICDYFRYADLHGYGPGLYHPAATPVHPHPHCACRLSKTFRDPSEWRKPKRPIPKLNPKRNSLEAVEEALRRGARGNPRAKEVTPELVARIRGQARPLLRDAIPDAPPPGAETVEGPDFSAVPGWKGEAESIAMYTREGADLNNLRSEDFTEERQRLHDELIERWFEGFTPSETPPRFVMTGGGTAAGKGTLISNGVIQVRGRTLVLDDASGRRSTSHNIISIDSDEIKKAFPEWGQIEAAEKAGFLHEESSYLAKRMMRRALEGGYDIFYDSTGDGGYEDLVAKIAKYRSKGHRVEAWYVTVDVEEAVARNLARYKKTGRYVDEAYVRQVHSNINSWIAQAAGKDTPFDDIHWFDTTGGKTRLASRSIRLPNVLRTPADVEAARALLTSVEETLLNVTDRESIVTLAKQKNTLLFLLREAAPSIDYTALPTPKVIPFPGPGAGRRAYGDYFKEKYGVEVELDRIGDKFLDSVATETDRLLTKYKVNDGFAVYTYDKLDPYERAQLVQSIGVTESGYKGGSTKLTNRVLLNEGFYESERRMNGVLFRLNEKKAGLAYAPGMTARGAMTHEFGHVVDNLLKQAVVEQRHPLDSIGWRVVEEAGNRWRKRGVTDAETEAFFTLTSSRGGVVGIDRRGLLNFLVDRRTFPKALGAYAFTSDAELAAEMFRHYEEGTLDKSWTKWFEDLLKSLGVLR